jgi:hypothetical protein
MLLVAAIDLVLDDVLWTHCTIHYEQFFCPYCREVVSSRDAIFSGRVLRTFSLSYYYMVYTWYFGLWFMFFEYFIASAWSLFT